MREDGFGEKMRRGGNREGGEYSGTLSIGLKGKEIVVMVQGIREGTAPLV